ncbi:unnamed protein product [Psylliodes chrysocephalus]|uniref:THAP-type domain-containing protein n=1 Tax=Psylliodes chrysocephalus TaxID=3402493 RepID=A0A9P0CNT5_9CUCU|nr:unnamed protein product [Psylliodes chrysocephala]
MSRCFVIGCNNATYGQRYKVGVTFHVFPKVFQKEWLIATGRSVDHFVTHEKICSEHFKKSDFEPYGERKRIKPGVIPTQYVFSQPEIPVFTRNFSESDNIYEEDSCSNIDNGYERLTDEHSKVEGNSSSPETFPRLIRAFHTYSKNPSLMPSNLTSPEKNGKTPTTSTIKCTYSKKPSLMPSTLISLKKNGKTPTTSTTKHTIIRSLHTCSKNPEKTKTDILEKRINILQKRVAFLTNNLKVSRRISTRRKYKMKRMKKIICGLKRKMSLFLGLQQL